MTRPTNEGRTASQMAGGETSQADVTRVTVQRPGLQGGSGAELVPRSVAEGAGRRDLGQPDSRVGQRKWRERPARTVVRSRQGGGRGSGQEAGEKGRARG